MNRSRKALSTSGMLLIAKNLFKKIKGQVNGSRKTPVTLTDCMMSALAMFGLKYPSLLSFDEDYRESAVVKHNMSVLYGVNHVPSDTYMRERLDGVDPEDARKPFKKIFAEAQRGKVLEQFEYLDGYYLASGDATGMFSSSTVNCENCCVKEHKDGSRTYYHQMFCVSIVHPKQKTVIPLAPEPIMKSDGMTKNDCEFNAAQRWIKAFRKEHPHIKIIFLADGISSRGPYIRALTEGKMRYILGAKPGDHKALFEFAAGICEEHEYRGRDGKVHHYRYVNEVPLNDSNPDILVNFLDYTETDSKGKVQRFTWVTNILITKENIHQIMIGGRTRWKIENETFNTLKNQNYQFEHNFGHGNKNLSTVFAMLMMLAFLIDQIQEICDHFFQQALRAKRRKSRFWRALFGLFANYTISSWEDVWKALALGHKQEALMPNSS